MKVIRHSDAHFAAKLRAAVAASSLFDPVIEQRTRAILEGVQVRGDAALLEFTGGVAAGADFRAAAPLQ